MCGRLVNTSVCKQHKANSLALAGVACIDLKKHTKYHTNEDKQ